MKIARVYVSKTVLGSFFWETGLYLLVRRGVPKNSRLRDLKWDSQRELYKLTFESDEFKDIGPGEHVPEIEAEMQNVLLEVEESGNKILPQVGGQE